MTFRLITMLALLALGSCKGPGSKDYKAECEKGATRLKQCNPNLFLSQSEERFVERCAHRAGQGKKKYTQLLACLAKTEGDCQRVDSCAHTFRTSREPRSPAMGAMGSGHTAMGTSAKKRGSFSVDEWKRTPRRFCEVMVESLFTCLMKDKKLMAPVIDAKQKEKVIEQCMKSTAKQIDEHTAKMAGCIMEAGKDCTKVMTCLSMNRKTRPVMRHQSVPPGPRPTNNRVLIPRPPTNNRPFTPPMPPPGADPLKDYSPMKR